ncbi:MAG TPA: tetratricopeptide repeat protein [Candidatus Acidoferrales bacterium]|nr:tetratricopeptide repeat protein [Candidatus Acidoferrales bacterium]
MKIHYLVLIMILVSTWVAGPASAQVITRTTDVHGQIFLPDGNTPTESIRFELRGTDGSYDLRFTDSHGRFILERLISDISYTIFVPSNETVWGDTQIEFIPDQFADPRFYLAPLTVSKPARPSPYKPKPQVEGWHDDGIKAFQEGKAEEAEKLLRQATDADPKYATAFNDLGVILMREHKYPNAEQVFRKGLEATPKSATLLENLGIDLVHQAKYEDAIPPLKESLLLQPTRGEAHLQLGAALVETGKFSEAEAELLAARRNKGADEAGLDLYLGKLYASTGEFPKALEAFDAYLKLVPQDSPSRPTIIATMQRMRQEMAKSQGH